MAESTAGHDTLTTLATSAADAKAKVATVESLRAQLAAAITEANAAIDKQEASHKAHVDTITAAFPLPPKIT